jgi:hypothetical protein
MTLAKCVFGFSAVVFYGHLSKQGKTMKTWEKTREQNLASHSSGRYHALAFANGKEIWKSLLTSHFSVAKSRLAEFLKEHREKQAAGSIEASAKMTFADALKIHQQKQADNLNIKPSTRHYWNQVFVSLMKSWPGLGGAWSPAHHDHGLQGIRGPSARRLHPPATTTP